MLKVVNGTELGWFEAAAVELLLAADAPSLPGFAGLFGADEGASDDEPWPSAIDPSDGLAYIEWGDVEELAGAVPDKGMQAVLRLACLFVGHTPSAAAQGDDPDCADWTIPILFAPLSLHLRRKAARLFTALAEVGKDRWS